ncbi:MAG: tRNA preQ1(34) S-adenosylmethionine ribosyltransferase-isomerase QueA [Quisquiliibacterium sp.]
MMRLSDFDFDLPDELIAQTPAVVRSDSRLLQVGADTLQDLRFSELPTLLEPGDLLVMNDTRVIKARLLGHRAPGGGRIEALIERITDEHEAIVMLRSNKPVRYGAALHFGAASATVLGRRGDFFRLRFDSPVLTVLERDGSVPLPPYILHSPGEQDDSRYQTVYARDPGAVAAPTAGLHFDAVLMHELQAKGVRLAFVTLHVGAGTFRPVRVEDLSQHQMHEERFMLPESTADAIRKTREHGGRVIAVGTTSLRTLETAATESGLVTASSGETKLFITPGYRFKVVDALITNFHLPRSTLLMLVSAFAGVRQIRNAYRHAIEQRYRFFSYGDAMLLTRCQDALAQ